MGGIAPIAKTPSAAPISGCCESLFVRLNDLPQEIHILGLTSCSRGEGVTTVATQLSATAARSLKLPVILVDCNLLHPSVHRVFGVPIGPGVCDALRDEAPLDEFVQPSPIPNLSLLTAGARNVRTPIQPWSLSFSRRLRALSEGAGLVIVDLPASTEASPPGIGKSLDAALLVVEAEKIGWEFAKRTTAVLKRAGVNVLGAVMNKRRYHLPGWLYEAL